MRAEATTLATILLSTALMCGCGGSGAGSGGNFGSGGSGENQTAAPTISSTPAQNGAVIVSLASATDAVIFYTVDGSTPTPSSQQYQAPFLVSSNLTVSAIAISGAS
jgi:hypothetical protein